MSYTSADFNNQDLYKIYEATVSGAGVGGSGTLNYVAKFTPDGSTIGDSQIFDNGTRIGFNKNSGFSNFSFITITDPGVLFEDSILEIEDVSNNLVFSFNNNGGLSIGAGRVPSAMLHVVDDTLPQARFGYDTSTNYSTISVDATGLTTFDSNTNAGFKFNDQVYHAGKTGITTNTAFGLNALDSDTNAGQNNTAFGYNALTGYVAAVTGYGGNTAFGASALAAMIGGTSNTAIGNFAMGGSTTGTLNIAIGSSALANSSCSNSIGIGQSVLQNASGQYNTSVGDSSSVGMAAGTRNSAFGYYALHANTSGGYNVAFGNGALCTNVSGSNNVAVGNNAGAVATGSYNLFLGNYAGGFQGAVSNYVIIDTLSRGSAGAELTSALLFGITNATVSSQRLRINANVGIGGAATSTSPLNVTGFPTSAAGLVTGDFWNDSGTVKII